jgi:crotonobetainyl-CoA:carnitine CoA-transferase CaiB-like acyl-CoA transferase
MKETSGKGALTGIVVIELGMVMQVPLAGQMLADYGARVIKVERPGSGDILRTLDPIANERGTMSCYYAALCRNKYAVCLDIKQPAGLAALLRMIDQADVLMHNFRPGVMERLGLGYADLAKRNPGLIYAGGYAFGEDGPMSKFPGQDMLSQAFSGFTMSGRGAQEEPKLSNPPLMDYSAAVSLTQGILAALVERGRSGEGQAVSTSLLEVAIGMQTLEIASKTMHGAETSWVRQSMVYRAKDGWVVVLMLFRDNPLQLLCRAFDVADLSAEDRFGNVELQIANKSAIQELFAPHFAGQSVRDILDRLSRVDILCSPINHLSDVLHHPQTEANASIWTIDVPGHGDMRVAGSAVRLSRTPAAYRRSPTWVGADNEQVLRSFGFDVAEIDGLQQSNILTSDPRSEAIEAVQT